MEINETKKKQYNEFCIFFHLQTLNEEISVYYQNLYTIIYILQVICVSYFITPV